MKLSLLNQEINKTVGGIVFTSLTALCLLAGSTITPVLKSGTYAYAQESEQPRRKGVRVESIRQKHIKTFERINEAFDQDNFAEAASLLAKLEADPDLNNIEKSYIYTFKGNIAFTRDDLQGALREFKKIIDIKEGIPVANYNQNFYVIAQVYFSLENYSEALRYAKQWFNTQEEPTADGYMLIGQAQYMLKRYDEALPNVQAGINKYVEIGSIPKEGWLNLLSNIYRQKNEYQKMVPVLKQLVTHYPKKTYLSTLGGVYNELNDQGSMTALFQAMYDQNLLTSESEIFTLASLKLSEDNPYQAAQIMKSGLESGALKKNLKNYRMYSQALYMAREYDAALEPLSQAARLGSDGKLYDQLGQSYMSLGKWSQAESALKQALAKGRLTNTGQTKITLGSVQFEQKKFEAAKKTFQSALRHDKYSSTAQQWITYVNNEVTRLAELKKEIVINTDVEPEST